MAGSSSGEAVENDGWMRGSSASLRGGLLALVLERPGHGYELANRLADRLGESWLIVRKDVYRLLEGLQDDGLLLLREEREAGRRQLRLVYYPTELTARAVSEWMETLIPKEPMRVGIRAQVAGAFSAGGARALLEGHAHRLHARRGGCAASL
jgi:DNA-binding PadR family transcriptional regulator